GPHGARIQPPFAGSTCVRQPRRPAWEFMGCAATTPHSARFERCFAIDWSGALLEVVRDLLSRFVRVVDDDRGSLFAGPADTALGLGGSPSGHLKRLRFSVVVSDGDFTFSVIDVGHHSLGEDRKSTR